VETVTISPKFQIEIPEEIRQRLGPSPGQKIQAFASGDRFELIPVRPAVELRGFLKGIDTRVDREADRDMGAKERRQYAHCAGREPAP
jgi:AbrB family looped-hinge helix DNA binding protein